MFNSNYLKQNQMKKFNLDDPLLEFVTKQGRSVWSIRHALQNVHIWGAPGAGKSSSVGARIAIKALQADFGALIMCVKPSESQNWIRYCKEAGREKDLLVVEPGGANNFNFLDWEIASANGHFIADNIVDLLTTIISAGQNEEPGDNFWVAAQRQLVTNVVELVYLAYKKVSVELMFDVVSTIPENREMLEAGLKSNVDKPFFLALEKARINVDAAVKQWLDQLPENERQLIQESDSFQERLIESIPSARALKYVDQFFIDVYVGLAEKTKSIIFFKLIGFLSYLLREPVYSLFCKNPSNFSPEDVFRGKVVVLNIPVKKFHRAGIYTQNIFKYIFQRSAEQRIIDDYSRPVLQWSDENQFFLLPGDQEFQTTCRSSRVSCVSLSQNLSNYYAQMTGRGSHDRVTSLMGTIGTQFYLSNSDVATNQYASSLIGEDYFEDISSSINKGRDFSEGRSSSYKLERLVRPEAFGRLKTGGPKNDFIVEAYMHLQGDLFASGFNHQKVSFTQLLD